MKYALLGYATDWKYQDICQFCVDANADIWWLTMFHTTLFTHHFFPHIQGPR